MKTKTIKKQLSTGIRTVERNGKIEVLTAQEHKSIVEYQTRKYVALVNVIIVLVSIFFMCMGWTNNELN